MRVRAGHRSQDVLCIGTRDLVAKADLAERFPGLEGGGAGIRLVCDDSGPRAGLSVLDRAAQQACQAL